MCIETQSLATALLPSFAQDVGYNVQLFQLISGYQKNPGTETYQAVQKFLLKKRNEQQKIMNTFYEGKPFNRIDLNILDYEDNLLWSTARLSNQDKIILLYQASEYSPQATQGSGFKQFETGEKYTLSFVSGAPLFPNGGALRIGVTLVPAGDCEISDDCQNGYDCGVGVDANGVICASKICCNGVCASSC